MSERLNLCRLAEEGKYSISELARSFGVSRKTAYKWLHRYDREGVEGIFNRSRRPKSSPAGLCDDVVDAVVKLKGEFEDWGPRKLHKLLIERNPGLSCSRSSVERILTRHGLTQKREPGPTPEEVGRFERGEPNELWQIDFTAPFSMPGGAKVWPVPILDDNARFCVALNAAPTCSAGYALECLRAAAVRYGMPLEVLSDHGSAFGTNPSHVSEFTAFLWACDIKHTQGRYAHPQTQGKLERFNRTLRRECIRKYDYDNLDDWNKCFEDYRHIYNDIRPHQSLCDETPTSRYVASPRAFVEPDRLYREDGEGLINRKVGCDGKIWINQHHVRVSRGLAGWVVYAKHDGNGFWSIYFRGHNICQVSLAKQAIYKPKP